MKSPREEMRHERFRGIAGGQRQLPARCRRVQARKGHRELSLRCSSVKRTGVGESLQVC